MIQPIKMRKILALLLIISLFSCSVKKEDSNNFTLNGKIKGNYDSYIVLSYGDKRDSVIIKNNTFKFSGTINSNNESEAFLELESAGNLNVVFLENKEIFVEAKHKEVESNGAIFNQIFVRNVEGSKHHTLWDSWGSFYRKNYKSENFGELSEEKLIRTIDSFPDSYINGRILRLYLKSNTLSETQARGLKSVIDTTTMISYDLESFNTNLNAIKRISKGAAIKSFDLKNSNDLTQPSYVLNNKVTLIDFWASWCGPCRKAHPEMKRIYNVYNSNFDIISVSLDEEKEDWISAIKKDQLTWTNLIGEKDWDSEISLFYGLNSLPFNILVDANGKVLDNNIDPTELETFLEQQVE